MPLKACCYNNKSIKHKNRFETKYRYFCSGQCMYNCFPLDRIFSVKQIVKYIFNNDFLSDIVNTLSTQMVYFIMLGNNYL